MKRRALKLFLFLVAGAIINVAVAWSAVLGFPCAGGSPAVVRLDGCWWHGDYGKRRAGTATLNWVRTGEGDFAPWLDKSILIDAPSWSALAGRNSSTNTGMVEVVSGFPQPSLYMRYRVRHPDTETILTSLDRELEQASRYGVLPAGVLFLPMTPIFPGITSNTIFYAAVLWLLFAAPFALRRRIRLKRGQCSACRYSLRENVSEKCPECGAAVSQNRDRQERRNVRRTTFKLLLFLLAIVECGMFV